MSILDAEDLCLAFDLWMRTLGDNWPPIKTTPLSDESPGVFAIKDWEG